MFRFGTFANFKHYYLHYIRIYLRREFPDAVSYNRFVELESRVFFKLMFFLKLYAFRQMYRHQLCGQYNDSRLPQPEAVCQQGFQGHGHKGKKEKGLAPWLQVSFHLQ